MQVKQHGDEKNHNVHTGAVVLDDDTPPDQRPKAPTVFHEWMTWTGLSGHGYRVRGFWNPDDPRCLGGYQVEMNVPACTFGSNVLIDPSVPRAASIAFELVLLELLKVVKNPGAIYAFDREKIILYDTDITDGFDGKTPAGAVAGLHGYILLTELSNDRILMNPSHSNATTLPAFSVGQQGNATGYLKHREIDQAAYIKMPPVSGSTSFHPSAIITAIYAYGVCRLRQESHVKGAFLKKQGLTTLESWRRYGSDKAYQIVRNEARRISGLDTKLRARRPKAEHLAKLAQIDREMVEMLLNGNNPRNHPAVVAYPTKNEGDKYFSAVKRRVLDKLSIDLSLPWTKQQAVAASGIYELMKDENRVGVPVELQAYCFTNQSTAKVLRSLELEVVRGCNNLARKLNAQNPTARPLPIRRLAEIDVGYFASPNLLLDANRLHVDDRAKEALKEVDRPLYPILDAYQLGCFGDGPEAEVKALTDANRKAIEQHQTVRGVFLAGNNQIVVKTDFHQDDQGAWLPSVTVTAERVPLARA